MNSSENTSQGYFRLMTYLGGLACVGILINFWLYYDDLYNRNGILNAIDAADSGEENDKEKEPEEGALLGTGHNEHQYDDEDIDLATDEHKNKKD